MGLFSGSGQGVTLKGVVTNSICLAAGQVQIISPAGWWAISPGPYTTIQQLDPITGIWRNIGNNGMAGSIEYMYSDGVNYRLANQTGCAVGAIITNVGSGYTSAPTVVATSGGSVWKAILGGAISQTVTVTNGGVNYTYPPIVQIAAPPAGGIQATAYATISSGVVTAVTVVDQGAGYTTAPTITFVNDPREGLNATTVGYNAAAITTLLATGTITGLLCLDHGSPTAATTIPTFTISGGGGGSAFAATAVMCWTVTSLGTGNVGAGITAPVGQILCEDQVTATASTAVKNPTVEKGLVKTRPANIWVGTTGSAMNAYSTASILDGGIYAGAPLCVVAVSPSTTVTTAATTTAVMGGVADVSYMTQY
jgi:hypothetical protein